MQQLIDVMQGVFNHPPGPFNPATQTLKGWVVYCLRDRGFMVSTAANADFTLSSRGEKVSFKITQDEAAERDPSVGWVVVDASGKTAKVIAPQG